MKQLLAMAMTSVLVFAAHADKHDKKEHKHGKMKKAHAHVHGSGKAEMAFEGPNGQLNLEFPAESVFGFEYLPKTEAEKKAHHDAISLLETNISDMVKFPADSKCEISKDSISDSASDGGTHADVDAKFKVVCEKSPVGTEIEFNFQKTFPKLKKVDVTILADAVQTKGKANKNGAKIKVKK